MVLISKLLTHEDLKEVGVFHKMLVRLTGAETCEDPSPSLVH